MVLIKVTSNIGELSGDHYRHGEGFSVEAGFRNAEVKANFIFAVRMNRPKIFPFSPSRGFRVKIFYLHTA